MNAKERESVGRERREGRVERIFAGIRRTLSASMSKEGRELMENNRSKQDTGVYGLEQTGLGMPRKI